MPIRPTTRLLQATAAATVGALALAGVAADPAAANSFERGVHEGKVWYTDSKDRFCVRAQETNIRDRAFVKVTLTPYNSARGPVVRVSDLDTPGATCKSLARAYEDTRYKATIKSELIFDREDGTIWETTRVSFYS